jgi:ParB family chromosome partitioning protein
MTPKRGLGRGIAALLPEEDDAHINTAQSLVPEQGRENSKNPGDAAVELVALVRIKTNPDQPRKIFNDEELTELADSIREHGIIQPVIVEETSISETGEADFIVGAGERRIRAAKIAGLSKVPVIVRKYSEEKRMAVALIENVQRSDLNPIEEAKAYKRLMELAGLSQDEAAVRVGKNRSTVANSLRLLKLPIDMQESIQKGELSAGHARAILSVLDLKNQDLLFREILKKNLSVREAEKTAVLLNGEEKKAKKTEPPVPSRSLELNAMEEKFLNRLGTKVKIKGDLNAGTIEIDYYSMEDLDRLYELLG